MTCRFVASDQPRVISGRHAEECADRYSDDANGCRGCAPCTEPHCRVCRRTHAEGTCAECLATVRADLHEIARLCHALPEEVAHRGVEGEAMMLLGPVADPEQWGHTEASIAVGRLPKDWLETADGELHPLFVLGTWDATWRDALEHSEPAGVVTLALAVDYLDRTLTYMAAYEHVPFEDFSRDLRRCVGRLEAVLHDGQQIDRTQVPCLTCGALLERRFGRQAADDHHACPKCRQTYSGEEFRLAKANWLADKNAERFVNISDAALAIERSEYTIRTWVRRDIVRTMRSPSGRLLVWWPEVRSAHRERQVRETRKKAG